jgi:hypothetical protein
MVDLWPHCQMHLRESDLLLKISHCTICATGRSHTSTVWLKKKSRLWLQIQILKLLLMHHQVDPRIIKAYLMGESIPTYLPGHLLSRHFGILPTYLPRDWFLPSELVVPLVDAQYCRDYHVWKRRLDANTRATDFFSWSHPSLTISQVIEAPVCTPFVPTVRAAELRWWNGYFNTYHSFDDLILLGGHYQNSFNWRAIRTVSWHTGKSAQDIYATALTILQVGLPTTKQPPNEQTSDHAKMIYLQKFSLCDQGAEVSTDYWQSTSSG